MSARLSTLLLLVAPLAACATPGTSFGPAPSGHSGLEARILPSMAQHGFAGGGNISFATNRPASVAVFEILPGRGASMVYPRGAWQAGIRGPGLHHLNLGFVTQRWAYQPQFVGRVQSPRYYLLVASEQPLRTEHLVGSSLALRHQLGMQRFASFSPYRVMDDLVHAVVAHSGVSSYTTDVYVDWPDPMRGASPVFAQRGSVVCLDGRIVANPIHCPQVATPGIERPDTLDLREPRRADRPARGASEDAQRRQAREAREGDQAVRQARDRARQEARERVRRQARDRDRARARERAAEARDRRDRARQAERDRRETPAVRRPSRGTGSSSGRQPPRAAPDRSRPSSGESRPRAEPRRDTGSSSRGASRPERSRGDPSASPGRERRDEG